VHLFLENSRVSIRRRVAGSTGGRKPFAGVAQDPIYLLFVVSRPHRARFLDPRAGPQAGLDPLAQHAPRPRRGRGGRRRRGGAGREARAGVSRPRSWPRTGFTCCSSSAGPTAPASSTRVPTPKRCWTRSPSTPPAAEEGGEGGTAGAVPAADVLTLLPLTGATPRPVAAPAPRPAALTPSPGDAAA